MASNIRWYHKPEPELYFEESDGWAAHFLRGLASLRTIGFVKMLSLLGPET